MNSFFKKYGLPILLIFHLVGFVGISYVDQSFFAGLTPFNLLLSAFLVIMAHRGRGLGIWVLLAFTFLAGFAVEWLGTATGIPFGQYTYGQALGPKILEVPMVIGINWFLMVMGAGYIAHFLTSHRLGQVVLAAVLMTMCDLAIEPVAPLLNYWHWQQGQAPLMNYLGWLGVSLIMQMIFQKTVSHQANPLAIPYLFIVNLFFVGLNLSL